MVGVSDGCLLFLPRCRFTGISEGQARALTEQAHVYMPLNGRISIAGLNRHNIRYFAESLDRAMRGQL